MFRDISLKLQTTPTLSELSESSVPAQAIEASSELPRHSGQNRTVQVNSLQRLQSFTLQALLLTAPAGQREALQTLVFEASQRMKQGEFSSASQALRAVFSEHPQYQAFLQSSQAQEITAFLDSSKNGFSPQVLDLLVNSARARIQQPQFLNQVFALGASALALLRGDLSQVVFIEDTCSHLASRFFSAARLRFQSLAQERQWMRGHNSSEIYDHVFNEGLHTVTEAEQRETERAQSAEAVMQVVDAVSHTRAEQAMEGALGRDVGVNECEDAIRRSSILFADSSEDKVSLISNYLASAGTGFVSYLRSRQGYSSQGLAISACMGAFNGATQSFTQLSHQMGSLSAAQLDKKQQIRLAWQFFKGTFSAALSGAGEYLVGTLLHGLPFAHPVLNLCRGLISFSLADVGSELAANYVLTQIGVAVGLEEKQLLQARGRWAFFANAAEEIGGKGLHIASPVNLVHVGALGAMLGQAWELRQNKIPLRHFDEESQGEFRRESIQAQSQAEFDEGLCKAQGLVQNTWAAVGRALPKNDVPSDLLELSDPTTFPGASGTLAQAHPNGFNSVPQNTSSGNRPRDVVGMMASDSRNASDGDPVTPGNLNAGSSLGLLDLLQQKDLLPEEAAAWERLRAAPEGDSIAAADLEILEFALKRLNSHYLKEQLERLLKQLNPENLKGVELNSEATAFLLRRQVEGRYEITFNAKVEPDAAPPIIARIPLYVDAEGKMYRRSDEIPAELFELPEGPGAVEILKSIPVFEGLIQPKKHRHAEKRRKAESLKGSAALEALNSLFDSLDLESRNPANFLECLPELMNALRTIAEDENIDESEVQQAFQRIQNLKEGRAATLALLRQTYQSTFQATVLIVRIEREIAALDQVLTHRMFQAFGVVAPKPALSNALLRVGDFDSLANPLTHREHHLADGSIEIEITNVNEANFLDHSEQSIGYFRDTIANIRDSYPETTLYARVSDIRAIAFFAAEDGRLRNIEHTDSAMTREGIYALSTYIGEGVAMERCLEFLNSTAESTALETYNEFIKFVRETYQTAPGNSLNELAFLSKKVRQRLTVEANTSPPGFVLYLEIPGVRSEFEKKTGRSKVLIERLAVIEKKYKADPSELREALEDAHLYEEEAVAHLAQDFYREEFEENLASLETTTLVSDAYKVFFLNTLLKSTLLELEDIQKVLPVFLHLSNSQQLNLKAQTQLLKMVVEKSCDWGQLEQVLHRVFAALLPPRAGLSASEFIDHLAALYNISLALAENSHLLEIDFATLCTNLRALEILRAAQLDEVDAVTDESAKKREVQLRQELNILKEMQIVELIRQLQLIRRQKVPGSGNGGTPPADSGGDGNLPPISSAPGGVPFEAASDRSLSL